MDSRVIRAQELFENGQSCSQSVFAAFAPSLGLEEAKALAIAAPMGGGIVRSGKTCGAAVGALLAIGLKHGHLGKAENYRIGQAYMKEFQEQVGNAECREILGVDVSTEEGRKASADQGLHGKVCTGVVSKAAQILVRYLEDANQS